MSQSRFHQQFENWATGYERSAAAWEYSAPRVVADTVLRNITPERARGTLLDLGTGTGKVLEALKGQFARTVGVDFSAAMLSVCRDKGVADTLVEADLGSSPWPVAQHSAHVVTAAGLLEFIQPPEDFLKNMAEVMTEDAIAVLTYESSVAVKKGLPAMSYRFSPHRMEHAAAQAGLRIIETDEFQGFRMMGQPIPYGLMVLSR